MAGWRVLASWHQLLLLLLPLLLPVAQACMDTVLQMGTMADSELIAPELQVTSSCSCCGLCHHYAGCASLSFSSASSTCRLYKSVPDFSRLIVDKESELFVRPGRSGHHQFCRDDSDCVEPDERCSGRVCTDDPTVTCRDLAETLSAPMNDVYYGSLNLTLMQYYCASHSGIDGWTLISRATTGNGMWTYDDLLERNKNQPTDPSYSILRHADELSLAGAEERFQILVLFKYPGIEKGFVGSLPLEQTLLPTDFTGPGSSMDLLFTGPDSGVDLQVTDKFGGYPSAYAILPWVQPTMKALLSLTGPQGGNIYWSLINTHGEPHLYNPYKTAEYYVRE